MFIPDYSNLLERKLNVKKHLDYINNLDTIKVREALEIEGKIYFSNGENKLIVSNVYALSFLFAASNDINDKSLKEYNIHYWEDCGHRIDIELNKEKGVVKIIDSNTKEKLSIEMNQEDFKVKMKEILDSIFNLCKSVFYPLVDREDFYSELKNGTEI